MPAKKNSPILTSDCPDVVWRQSEALNDWWMKTVFESTTPPKPPPTSFRPVSQPR